MDNQRLDLGVVTSVRAESIGEPGQRTFRVLAETLYGQVCLWLEKEQVAMLGSAIAELLARVPPGKGQEPESDALSSFTGELEVKAGSLAIGYDATHHGFTMEAGEFTSPMQVTSISFLATRRQFDDMREQIAAIVAAGRPRCVLCGAPLTGAAHFCPESNGHVQPSRPD